MAITRVQASARQNSGLNTTLSAASLTLTAGNCLVVLVSWGDSDRTFVTGSPAAGQYQVTGGGLTYTELAHAWSGVTGQGAAIVVALNVSGGATAPTVNFQTNTDFLAIKTVEFSGIKTSAATDVSWTVNTASSGTSISAGSQTVAAGSLAIAAGIYDLAGGTASVGSGWTLEENDSANTGMFVEYLIDSGSGGSYDANFTRSGSTGGLALDAVALLAAATSTFVEEDVGRIILPFPVEPIVMVYA